MADDENRASGPDSGGHADGKLRDPATGPASKRDASQTSGGRPPDVEQELEGLLARITGKLDTSEDDEDGLQNETDGSARGDDPVPDDGADGSRSEPPVSEAGHSPPPVGAKRRSSRPQADTETGTDHSDDEDGERYPAEPPAERAGRVSEPDQADNAADVEPKAKAIDVGETAGAEHPGPGSSSEGDPHPEPGNRIEGAASNTADGAGRGAPEESERQESEQEAARRASDQTGEPGTGAPSSGRAGPADDTGEDIGDDIGDEPPTGPSWPKSWGPKPEANVDRILSEMLNRIEEENGPTERRDNGGNHAEEDHEARNDEWHEDDREPSREMVPARTPPPIAPILGSVLEAANLSLHEAAMLNQGRPLPSRAPRHPGEPRPVRTEVREEDLDTRPPRAKRGSLRSMVSRRLRSVRVPDDADAVSDDPGTDAFATPEPENPDRGRRRGRRSGNRSSRAENDAQAIATRTLKRAADADQQLARINTVDLARLPGDAKRRPRTMVFAGAAIGGTVALAAAAVVAFVAYPELTASLTASSDSGPSEPQITVERSAVRPPRPVAPRPVAPDQAPQVPQRTIIRDLAENVSNESIDTLSTFRGDRAAPSAFGTQPSGATGSVISVERTTVNPQTGANPPTRSVTDPEVEKLQSEAVARIGRFQIDEAEALLEQVLARAPAYVPALSARGKVKVLRRDYIAAEADFQEALRIAPNALSARLGRVEALIGQGRSDEALLQITPILGANAREAAAYDLRARAYAIGGALDRARADCATLGELVGAGFITDWCIGVAAKEAGDASEAQAAFTRSLQSAEETFILHRQLYLRFRGHYDGAIDGDVGPGTLQAVAACVADRSC